MKKALLIAPAASVLRSFCDKNIKCLQKLGYEVYLAANFEDCDAKKQVQYDEFVKKCGQEEITVFEIKFYRRSLFKNFKSIQTLRKLIVDKEFDLIHCHTDTGGLITALALPRRGKARRIYTPHGISFYKGGSIFRWLAFYPVEKWICSKMDCVLAINGEEYEIINSWKNNETLFVHGVGVDTDHFERLSIDRNQKRSEFNINPEDFMIMCVGELCKNKNHRVIIKAISMINRQDIQCIICGVGELKDELQKMIDDHGLSERIMLTGYRTDVAELLSAADLFAFPSFHEGLPVSVMEAMSAGLPVVCSEIRGNVDLIRNEEGGFLCAPSNAEQFKNAIEKLIDDVDLRSKMSAVNKEKVRAYDISEVEKEIHRIYTQE